MVVLFAISSVVMEDALACCWLVCCVVATSHGCRSNIVPIRLFGLFMALLVLYNYVLVVLYFPSLLVIQQRLKACDFVRRPGRSMLLLLGCGCDDNEEDDEDGNEHGIDYED